MLDFSDLLVKTIQLFKERRDLLRRERDRYRYIHVAEFQDTNYLQGKLARMLAGRHGNICVVGDDDQSIHGFHGAYPDNIRKFTTQYPSGKTITLEQNYRSTERIVNASLAVIKNNNDRIPKNLSTDNRKGGPIKIIRNSCDMTEAQEIAKTICLLHSLKFDNFDYRDIAVLFRSRWVADKMKKELHSKKIPVLESRKDALNDVDKVALLTVHSAKGLEYKAVFMIGLEQGIFPNKHEQNNLEEERRLFYVGMTRAKKLLYLSYVSRRGQRTRSPSIFLNEVPHALTR